MSLSLLSAPAAAAELPPEMLRQIETLQRRAAMLSFDALDPASYHLAKARAWLDLALSEYHEKDAGGIIENSISQAETLIQALEQNNQSALSMRMPPQTAGSETVRPELHEKLAALKNLEKFPCGQRETATAEVYLVWAGHEFSEYGMSHAESYLRSVENLAHDARVAIENCVYPVPQPLEKITLSGDALFAFNKSTLNRNALWRLDELAGKIVKMDGIEEISLVGHTDQMRSDGHPERNQLLSEQRAERIRQYLINKGIPAEKIQASGAGASQPVVTCATTQSRAKQIACLQPNRRVEITLRGAMNGGDARPVPKEAVPPAAE